jgi:hypothetical protein
MSKRQVLLDHIQERHRTAASMKHWTYDELADWHGHEHHRFAMNHIHEGENLGPDRRPVGWRTGEGVIEVRR